MLTWRKVAELISRMPPDRQDDTATVYLRASDEYLGVESLHEGEDDGVLDVGHFIMVIDF